MELNLFGQPQGTKERTLRIPYPGSKNLIANEIISAILSYSKKRERFIDLFTGGGAMIYGMKQHSYFKEYVGIDINKELIDLHNNLSTLDLMYVAKNPCLLTKANNLKSIYPFLKNIDEIENKYKFIFKIVYSFGNNMINNLWGADISIKYDLSYKLLNEPENLSGAISKYLMLDKINNFKYNTSNVKNIYNSYKHLIGTYKISCKQQLEQLQQLGRLQQLQQLEHLQQLEQLGRLERLEQLKFINVSYDDFMFKNTDVVYFDPPYRGLGRIYNTENKHIFDNDVFENFARSLKCPVFISEYSNNIKGFKCIKRIPKLSLINNKGSSKALKQRYEHLHWNGIL